MSGAPSRDLLGRLRRFGWHHPEWWVVVIAAAAWVFMIGWGHAHAGHDGHDGAAAMMGDIMGAQGHGTLGMAAMVVAMMLPLTLANVRHVALSSLWRRRHRAVVSFLIGYLAVWLIVQAVIVEVLGHVAPLVGWRVAGIVAMVAAALWEIAPFKRHRLRRCQRTVPLAPRGWRADADCARYGVSTGISCVTMCWALMVACAAFAHSLPVMVVLFGVQLSGRYQRRFSPALAALAVLGGCLVPSTVGIVTNLF